MKYYKSRRDRMPKCDYMMDCEPTSKCDYMMDCEPMSKCDYTPSCEPMPKCERRCIGTHTVQHRIYQNCSYEVCKVCFCCGNEYDERHYHECPMCGAPSTGLMDDSDDRTEGNPHGNPSIFGRSRFGGFGGFGGFGRRRFGGFGRRRFGFSPFFPLFPFFPFFPFSFRRWF